MYFPAVIKDYGEQHLLVRFVMDAARSVWVTYEDISSWSNVIYVDWITRNGYSMSAEDTSVSERLKFQSELISALP